MNRADVVFVSLDNGFTFSYALPYLDGYLKKEGIEAMIIFPKIKNINKRRLAEEISASKPAVVAMGGLFGDICEIEEIISALRPYRKNFKIVVGGYMVTPTPEFTLLKTGADIAVVGEGEIIFADLVKVILGRGDIRNIKGLAILDKGRAFITGEGSFIEDLSDLPPINYDKFPLEHFIKVHKFYRGVPQNTIYTPRSRIFWVQTGRGCPFKCNFCYHHSRFRTRKIPDVIKETRELVERYSLNIIRFQDDLFTVNKARTLELCNALLAEGLKVKYIVSGHFEILDEEMIRALKESGCIQISLGVESGSQRVLDAIGKGTHVDKINEVMGLIRKYEIDRGVGAQVGQPGETEDEINKTTELMIRHTDEYTTPSITMTTPYPGSRLYDYALEKGLLKGHDDFYKRYRSVCDLSVNFTALPDDELVKVYRLAADKLVRAKWNAIKSSMGRIRFFIWLFKYYFYLKLRRFSSVWFR